MTKRKMTKSTMTKSCLTMRFIILFITFRSITSTIMKRSTTWNKSMVDPARGEALTSKSKVAPARDQALRSRSIVAPARDQALRSKSMVAIRVKALRSKSKAALISTGGNKEKNRELSSRVMAQIDRQARISANTRNAIAIANT
jgi:hypothetical protein